MWENRQQLCFETCLVNKVSNLISGTFPTPLELPIVVLWDIFERVAHALCDIVNGRVNRPSSASFQPHPAGWNVLDIT